MRWEEQGKDCSTLNVLLDWRLKETEIQTKHETAKSKTEPENKAI